MPNARANPEATVNPVLSGFHPDPSVCRVGDDFYLATSSFEYFPGVPIFHSTDLVHWNQIGNVLERPQQLALETAPSSGGVFAPTLRHHDGRVWMITTNMWGGGNFLVTAEDPAGPWSDPVLIDISGIDPDVCWGPDGTCYVTWCAFGKISQTTIDPLSGQVTGPTRDLWSGTGLSNPEAPHIYQIGDWWYLLIAEGGTERGHSVSVARGKSPEGPFEGDPSNPVLSHRSLDHPIRNTGHADLVQLVDGSWWMVLLGVRPMGSTPGFHVLGRETFLAPVDWTDEGWPEVGLVTEELAAPPIAMPALEPEPVRDDFDRSHLHPRWISVRRRRDEDFDLSARPGWLRLQGAADDLDGLLPVFVGRRQQHHRCRAATLVESLADEAGLAIRMDERHHVEIAVIGGSVVARARFGDLRQDIGHQPRPPGPVLLALRTEPMAPTGGPDSITLSMGTAEGWNDLATIDGRYLSTEVAGGFTGRVIGMYARGGAADFDWFDYEGEA